MSPFSWQGQNLCGPSLAFIIDWRVVQLLEGNLLNRKTFFKLTAPSVKVKCDQGYLLTLEVDIRFKSFDVVVELLLSSDLVGSQ